MKKLLMVIPLVILLCFTFSCQQGEEVAEEPVVDVEIDVEADVAAIKALLDEWVVLFNAGDFEKLVSVWYAEDAVSMHPNQPILEGREAILADYKNTREREDMQCDSSIAEDVRVSGDMAFARGNESYTVAPKDGGEPTKYDFKGVIIFERQPDGTWKCICEIGNSNLPEKSEEE